MARSGTGSDPIRGVLRIAALVAALVTVSTPWVTPAHAQDTGQLRALFRAGEASGPFMVSCIRGGEVVFQTEQAIASGGPYCMIAGSQDIPIGVYDVRVEGDGMVTQVKRGVLVTAENENDLSFTMALGEGVHTVEYATGGLAREEVAARLRALEAGAAAADDRLTTLERQLADLNRGRGPR